MDVDFITPNIFLSILIVLALCGKVVIIHLILQSPRVPIVDGPKNSKARYIIDPYLSGSLFFSCGILLTGVLGLLIKPHNTDSGVVEAIKILSPWLAGIFSTIYFLFLFVWGKTRLRAACAFLAGLFLSFALIVVLYSS